MGTNYYLRTDDKEEVDQHIGKNSRGWVFSFNGQVHKTYHDWAMRLVTMEPNEIIVDEYGNVHSTEDFIEMVQDTLKPWGPSRKQPANLFNVDEYGHVHSAEDFIEMVQNTPNLSGSSRKEPASIRESEQRGKQPKRNWQDRGFSFSNYEFC